MFTYYERSQFCMSSIYTPSSSDSSISKLNRSNTFGKKVLIDTFYDGDYGKENVQVPENNNSSDKESDREVPDFLSSEDSCDERFIEKQATRGVLRK